MANKCLRKCLRSGFLFFIHRQSVSANRNLTSKLHMHELYCNHLSSLSNCNSMRSSNYRSACLPLHLVAGQCREASSSSSTCFSAGEAEEYGYGDEVEHLQFSDNPKTMNLSDGHKLKARSHSCSKLQCRFMVPSFKSLLHRTHSHGRLQDGRHGEIDSSITNSLIGEHADEAECFNRKTAASSPSCLPEYKRSWSSPGLHIRRNMIKKAESFHGEPQVSSTGKRAPKGHVAVYVDAGKERCVVPIPYLSHPYFEDLLQRAESEYGFAQKGGLLIPCSLSELQNTLRRIHCDQISHP